MSALQLQRASSTEINGATPLHGGTEVVPLLRSGLLQADALVDIRGVIPCGIDGARIGAGATLAELECDPQVPEALRDSKHPPEQLSFRSLEGYVNARVIVEGLRRTGPNPSRAALRQALESLKNFDLGIGAPLTFGPERHQGLDNVYFTRVVSGRWAPITDWAAAVKA